MKVAPFRGSIESISVVGDSFRKEKLQSLLVVERHLDPQARQDAFCERQDALNVEFVGRLGVVFICASITSARSLSR